jgi:hypothetical protein
LEKYKDEKKQQLKEVGEKVKGVGDKVKEVSDKVAGKCKEAVKKFT